MRLLQETLPHRRLSQQKRQHDLVYYTFVYYTFVVSVKFKSANCGAVKDWLFGPT